MFVAVVFIFVHYGSDLPPEGALLEYSPALTTKIYSADEKLIEEFAIERRVITKINDIPLLVKWAFLIAEDKNFYKHHGIDLQSIFRAAVQNISNSSWKTKPAGGSTITQQVAKNLLVGNEKSFKRKIREAIMAFRIEESISKDKILEIYLNHIFLGKGCYGVAEACDYYFGKCLNDVAPEEAAFIACLPSAPSVYIKAIDKGPKMLLKRNSILVQLHEMQIITKQQLDDSLIKPIMVNFKKTKEPAPYFADEIHRQFAKYISETDFFSGGYDVITTMDSKIQNIAQKCLEDGLIQYTKSTIGWKGPIDPDGDDLKTIASQMLVTVNKILPVKVRRIANNILECRDQSEAIIKVGYDGKVNVEVGDVILCREVADHSYEVYQQPVVDGAIIVMEAASGNIIAMSGGYSFDISSFNCATQAKRQPGSVIKPFVYAAALENGMAEYDEIEDKPITIKLENGKYYSPHNYDKAKVYGKMPMRNGLIHSRNLATINLAMKIGTSKIAKILEEFELSDKHFNLSYLLGGHEVSLVNIISAFSAFVNDGYMIAPRFVTNVLKQNNTYVPFKKTICQTERRRVISSKTAKTIKNILRDTARYGTARRLASVFDEYPGIDVGGKTGTTNDFKDAWFVGYITVNKKTFIVGIFVGYRSPQSLGEHCTGAAVALPIFVNFLKRIVPKHANHK
jgi:penicillin-binding protein 1A